MYERTLKIINKEQFNKIIKKPILLVGLGGVGGYALESLVRFGFQNITIIDHDNISLSNLNRQIIATSENNYLNFYKSLNNFLKYLLLSLF